MEDIGHVFSGMKGFLQVVDPTPQFPDGVHRLHAWRGNGPKPTYVSKIDAKANRDAIVKFKDIQTIHRYRKYMGEEYWTAWDNMRLNSPKGRKRTKDEIIRDWWHSLAEAHRQGKSMPSLRSTINSYVQKNGRQPSIVAPSTIPTQPTVSAVQAKPPKDAYKIPGFRDHATRKAVVGKDPHDLSVILSRFLSLDRSFRVTKAEYVILQTALAKRFGTAPLISELQDIRREYLTYRGDVPFRKTWGYVEWAARARREWMVNKDGRYRILDLTPDAVCYTFPEYGVTEEGMKRIRDTFRFLVILNRARS